MTDGKALWDAMIQRLPKTLEATQIVSVVLKVVAFTVADALWRQDAHIAQLEERVRRLERETEP